VDDAVESAGAKRKRGLLSGSPAVMPARRLGASVCLVSTDSSVDLALIGTAVLGFAYQHSCSAI
jgi:hypothetical protein